MHLHEYLVHETGEETSVRIDETDEFVFNWIQLILETRPRDLRGPVAFYKVYSLIKPRVNGSNASVTLIKMMKSHTGN